MPLRVNVRRGKIKTENKRGETVPISSGDIAFTEIGTLDIAPGATTEVISYTDLPQDAARLTICARCRIVDVPILGEIRWRNSSDLSFNYATKAEINFVRDSTESSLKGDFWDFPRYSPSLGIRLTNQSTTLNADVQITGYIR